MAGNSVLVNLKSSGRTLVRVSFSNVGMSKVYGLGSASATKHVELPFIASVLGNLVIKPQEEIIHKSIPDLYGVDYVGYIIEKERLDKGTGNWIRIDDIKIFGVEGNKFLDSKVAYGQVYRYRIKSIAKLTKAKIRESSISDSAADLQVFESNTILEQLNKNQSLIENSLNITNLGLSSKSTNYTDLSIPIGNGKVFEANSAGTSVKQTENKNKKVNIDLSKIKNKKIEFFSSYFESNPGKSWTYVQTTELIPPPPPSTIKIVPNSYEKTVSLFWLKPANDQRDIKGYRVYRRPNVGFNWEELASLKEKDTFFIDKTVDFNNFYVYALTCVDVHNMESFLSNQIGVSLESQIEFTKEEKPLVWVSGPGVSPQEIDLTIKQFQEERGKVLVAKNNITIKVSTHFAESSKSFIVKIKSLDTHEVNEYKVVLKSVLVR